MMIDETKIREEITTITYGERAGRVQDKEMGMERLRAIGICNLRPWNFL